ncbi:hypothetical protein ACQ86N_45000 [Puia sp. P3]|uniref:hypothetical protein n=1 Tax=Puia sp. P3 TaxID=3423952 RepID=UPI003D67CEA4
MKLFVLSISVTLCLFLTACSTSQKDFRPDRKYAPEQLKEDYRVFRGVLEAWHPSLYWYTPATA